MKWRCIKLLAWTNTTNQDSIKYYLIFLVGKIYYWVRFRYLKISPKVRKIIRSNGKQNVNMKTLRSKVRWLLVSSEQMNFSGSACNLWLRCNNGIGVAMSPALKMGRMGSNIESQMGSLGIRPISREVGANILRLLVPYPGPIMSSSTGNGLKFGLGALVNMWMARPTIMNIGSANKKMSNVHMISQMSSLSTWKKIADIVTSLSLITNTCVAKRTF